MSKTIEERLKEMILNQYVDMKSFSAQAGIPNSTLSSMFQRGILNSTIGNVIQMAKALNISVDGLVEGKIEPKFYSDQILGCKKAPSDSDEAMKVATAYDAADSGTKRSVRKLLDIVDERPTIGLVARGGDCVDHPSGELNPDEIDAAISETLSET